jgi:hypothetical protein
MPSPFWPGRELWQERRVKSVSGVVIPSTARLISECSQNIRRSPLSEAPEPIIGNDERNDRLKVALGLGKTLIQDTVLACSRRFRELRLSFGATDFIASKHLKASGRAPTTAPAAQRERFRLAVPYGSTVIADPERKAIYQASAKEKGISVFALTIGDFLNAPAVEEIDLSGYTGKSSETIRVTASDDFEVTGVEVAITDSNGTVLERGPATRAPGSSTWNYPTTATLPDGQSVSIEVTATDPART